MGGPRGGYLYEDLLRNTVIAAPAIEAAVAVGREAARVQQVAVLASAAAVAAAQTGAEAAVRAAGTAVNALLPPAATAAERVAAQMAMTAATADGMLSAAAAAVPAPAQPWQLPPEVHVRPGARSRPPTGVTDHDAIIPTPYLRQPTAGVHNVLNDPEEYKKCRLRLHWNSHSGNPTRDERLLSLVSSSIFWTVGERAAATATPPTVPTQWFAFEAPVLRLVVLFSAPSESVFDPNSVHVVSHRIATGDYILHQITSRMLLDSNRVPYGGGLPAHTAEPPCPTMTMHHLHQFIAKVQHDLGWVLVRVFGW